MQKSQDWALQRLRQLDDIRAEIENDVLRVSVHGGPEVALQIKSAHRLSPERARDFVSRRKSQNESTPVILLGPTFPSDTRDILGQAGLSWLEYETGALSIRAPGVFIHHASDARPSPSLEDTGGREVPSLQGKAGVVVEALLLVGRSHEGLKLEDLEVMTGASKSWISRTVNALQEAGAVESKGGGPYKRWHPHPDMLLDLWEDRGASKPDASAGAYVWVRRELELFTSLKQLEEQDIRYAVGGVVAADLYEPTLTRRPRLEVWIDAAVPPTVAAHAMNGELVEEGANLVFWQSAGNYALTFARNGGRVVRDLGELVLVSPPRAYVECLQGTGRARAVAQKLRARIVQAGEQRRGEEE